jgi:hypothetical protein
LRKANEYKESFREIYEEVKEWEEGILKFTEWLEKVTDIYAEVIGKVYRHFETICNYSKGQEAEGRKKILARTEFWQFRLS